MKDYIVTEDGREIVLNKAAIIKHAKKAYEENDEELDTFVGTSLWCKAIFVAFYDLYSCTNIHMFARLFEMKINNFHDFDDDVLDFDPWVPIYKRLEKEFPKPKDSNNLLDNE